MLVRLAFAIATSVKPEVLLVDEILSAGDLSFQAKAKKRMLEMIAQARLLVFVSHDLASMSELCDRVIWMEQGRIKLDGPAEEVIRGYTEQMQPQAAAMSM